MNMVPGGMKRLWPHCLRRARALSTGAVLLFTAAFAGLIGEAVVIGNRGAPTMALAIAQAVAIILVGGPLLVITATGIRKIDDVLDRRKAYLRPSGPPIEQVAAELRRLLFKHHVVATLATTDTRFLGQVRAAEVAITERAVQAARALGVAHSEPPIYGAMKTDQLRDLLQALADAGLVLPLGVEILEPDRRV